MKHLEHGTWVLIADSEKALFTRNVIDSEDPGLEVIRKTEQDNPSNLEQSANRPGRRSDGPSGHLSAMDDTDWHELAKHRFADELADMLYHRAQRGAFDHIVLIAAPAVLGDLRDKLHYEVSRRVVAEIPKNLTSLPLDEIERRLRDGLLDG